MKIRLMKQEFFKNFVCMVTLAVVLIIYYYTVNDAWMIGDSIFLSGMFFMCLGLFRVVRRLGLFDSLIYGTERLLGKTKLDYYEYTETHEYKQSFLEILILSAGFMALSFIL